MALIISLDLSLSGKTLPPLSIFNLNIMEIEFDENEHGDEEVVEFANNLFGENVSIEDILILSIPSILFISSNKFILSWYSFNLAILTSLFLFILLYNYTVN